MKKFNVYLSVFLFCVSASLVSVHSHDLEDSDQPFRALIGADLLKSLKIPARAINSEIGVAVADIPADRLNELSDLAHRLYGRCGGFELLDSTTENSFLDPDALILESLQKNVQREKEMAKGAFFFEPLPERKEWIATAVDRVDAQRLGADIEWLSSYQTRYHKSDNKNQHVLDLKEKLENLVLDFKYSFPVNIELVKHKNTSQYSLRARIEGKDQAADRVILGGHLDSINQWGWSANSRSPGADDNASGSSALIEAFRALVQQDQPTRSVEFMWYAAEEVGLLGSAEIAKSYKADKVGVHAAMQLDMTGYPGSGENTIVLITDYTTAWLNRYLKGLNELYIQARVLETECGYACSDHASWFRQGYPVSFPFEASFHDYFKFIHTKNDLVKNGIEFEHSALFAKLAAAFALDLAYE